MKKLLISFIFAILCTFADARAQNLPDIYHWTSTSDLTSFGQGLNWTDIYSIDQPHPTDFIENPNLMLYFDAVDANVMIDNHYHIQTMGFNGGNTALGTSYILNFSKTGFISTSFGFWLGDIEPNLFTLSFNIQLDQQGSGKIIRDLFFVTDPTNHELGNFNRLILNENFFVSAAGYELLPKIYLNTDEILLTTGQAALMYTTTPFSYYPNQPYGYSKLSIVYNIPEPSSLLLSCFALGIIGIRHRRQG